MSSIASQLFLSIVALVNLLARTEFIMPTGKSVARQMTPIDRISIDISTSVRVVPRGSLAAAT